ncbi:MAG: hypothetical protein PHE83_08025 [Opitutaceae bacterium]|nr:hypothetical protein [Opitutaceae bacterium]
MNQPTPNRYSQIVLAVFRTRWTRGAEQIFFTQDDLIAEAKKVGASVKNLPDVLYTFRDRQPLPAEILKTGNWVIDARGPGQYALLKIEGPTKIELPSRPKVYDIPYAVPDIVAANLKHDEQGLLTMVRYNRLLDVFTGLACFHLQSHIRTQLPNYGQLEIDDLYLGVDKSGQGYVLPIEAKDSGDPLGIHKPVGIARFAAAKYPSLRCRPIAILRTAADTFAFMEFEPSVDLRKVVQIESRSYRLVREV